jgi:hypothetical protein
MNRWQSILVGGLALAALSGCQGVKEELGIGVRTPPDEFAVYSRAPLSLPPDYSLRPPAAGAAAESLAPRQAAKDVLLGSTGKPAGAAAAAPADPNLSSGQQALLKRTGGDTATPAVREQVNEESTVLAAADRSFVQKLMFWQTPQDYGTVVDPAAETRRIREAQALGQPVVTGETPVITRQPKALLEGIF